MTILFYTTNRLKRSIPNSQCWLMFLRASCHGRFCGNLKCCNHKRNRSGQVTCYRGRCPVARFWMKEYADARCSCRQTHSTPETHPSRTAGGDGKIMRQAQCAKGMAKYKEMCFCSTRIHSTTPIIHSNRNKTLWMLNSKLSYFDVVNSGGNPTGGGPTGHLPVCPISQSRCLIRPAFNCDYLAGIRFAVFHRYLSHAPYGRPLLHIYLSHTDL